MPFLCPKDGKPFPTKTDVARHAQKKHPDIPLPFSTEFLESIAEVKESEIPKKPTNDKNPTTKRTEETKTTEETTTEEDEEDDEDGDDNKFQCPDCKKVYVGKPPKKCECGAEFV